jgi:hypothetical protein
MALPFSQVLLMHDAAIDYVIMTNPWGSSDDEATHDKPPEEWVRAPDGRVDPFFAAESPIRKMAELGMFGPQMHVKRKSELPPDMIDLLEATK